MISIQSLITMLFEIPFPLQPFLSDHRLVEMYIADMSGSRDAQDPVPTTSPAGFPNPSPKISRFREFLRISKTGSKMILIRDPGCFEINDIQKIGKFCTKCPPKETFLVA